MGITREEKNKEIARRSLAYYLGDVYEDNLPVVAQIHEASVLKSDAFLVDLAKKEQQKLDKWIKTLEG
jgi:hypothetical protein